MAWHQLGSLSAHLQVRALDFAQMLHHVG